MNMLSFYGGPAGKDFTIAKIFPNKAAMDADIALGHDSPIYTGDYVLISYGDPNHQSLKRTSPQMAILHIMQRCGKKNGMMVTAIEKSYL